MQSHPAEPQAAKAPSVAEVAEAASFPDGLKEASKRFGVSLTPHELGKLFGCVATNSGTNYWQCDVNDQIQAYVEAPTLDSHASRLRFSLDFEFGFVLSQLEEIFGSQYRVVEGGKHGSRLYFDSPMPGSVGTNIFLSAKVWTRKVAPTSAVVSIDLLLPDT